MGEGFARTRRLLAAVAGLTALSLANVAHAQGEPPGRVGRLAFVDGTVSFHDDEQSGWTRAVVNTPLTTGDALWTEPDARSEISLAGTRIRMEGGTELGVAQLDDRVVRLQLPQGRVDVRTFAMDTTHPYEIQTPRGTIALQQQGDYYIEAGSVEDPTRLGVRSGAAQIQSLDGRVLAVRAGEVGEAWGDGNALQLRTIRAAPPAPPTYWASRDRQVIYDQPPQYVPVGMTGYEDLNAHGTWINDGTYGHVWSPRNVPPGWAPYRTGHWAYVKPWGWTWIDDQPWGFAPYHYGRWANIQGRWVWVPPQRETRPVYAPALVAFVGGIELALQLGNQSAAPVGWFPLGPREVYVPSYTTDRDYYRRLNRAIQIQDRELEERWERAQRREAFMAGRTSVLMNQRFATVVPTQAFVQSQPVQRAALRVAQDRVAAAAVAPVSAPPAPTASVAAVAATVNEAKPAAPKMVDPKATEQKAPAAAPAPAATIDANAKAEAEAKAKAAAPNVAVAKTAVAEMPTLAKPATTEAKKPASPGPKVAATEPKASTDAKDAKPAAPQLRPRVGAAPPQIKEADKPAPAPAPAPAPQAAPLQQKPDAPRQAAPAPAPQKPEAQPQQRQETPRQAAPAPQRPEAPQQQQPKREEPPKQAAPAPAPAPAPQQQPQQRQEQPRQAAPPPAPPQQQRPDAQPQRPPAQQAQPPQQQPQPPQRQNNNERNAPKADDRPQQQGQAPAPAPAPAPQRRNNDDKKDDKK
jgi:hypothetical protein